MQFAGDRSESVDAVVARVAGANGARVVRDVLLDLTVTTADYSFIVIDQYGLLIVDVEMWPGAVVLGASASKKWHARFAGAPKQSFANPLKENARRIDVLLEALLAFGRRIPRDYVTDLVVFVGAEIGSLALTDAEKARTTDAGGLEAALRARYDFAINSGAIETEEIKGLVSVLATINRFDTREAQARHGQGLKPRWALPFSRRKPEVEVGLADAVLGIAPVAPRLTGDRYPSLAAPPRKRAPIGGIVALVAVVALAGWLFLLGGYDLVTTSLADLTRRPAPPASEVTIPAASRSAPTVSIEVAKARLYEVSPEIYSTVVGIDSPQTMVSGGITAFTWQYVVQAKGGASPRVYNITLTIGADGKVRAMSSGR